jgi:PAS domain S-box-containing protein/putative nucleotidyltransferase with HDIG domain
MIAENHPHAVSIVPDVSEEKEAIRRSLSLLSATIESTPDGILVVDRQGRISRYNQKYLKLWRIPESMALAADEGRLFAHMARQLKDPAAFQREVKRLHTQPRAESFDIVEFKDGRIVERYSQPQKIGDEAIGRVWSFRDVTELRQAYAAMQLSEDRYRQLFESMIDVAYSIDRNFKILAVSPSVERHLGFTPEELVGKYIHEVKMMDPAQLEKAMRDAERVFSGERISALEYQFIAKDGTVKYGEVSGGPIFDGVNIVASISVGRDITDRKRAEEALRESEAKFHALFRNMNEGVALHQMVYDEDGRAVDYRILDVNPAYEKQTGISLEAAKGKSACQLYGSNAPPYLDIYDTVTRTGEPYSFETYYPPLQRYFEISIFSLKQSWFATVFSDITARKKADAALGQSLERLRRTLEATVQAMATTVETRDPYTAGHQRRVAALARAIAAEMGLTADQIDGIRMAAIIHDIGKISVPAEILSKPTELTEIELELIRTHAQSGYEILKDIEFNWPMARIVLEHHERMDGSGYPHGLTGDSLLIESRVLTVADVVEAIATNRPYRPAYSIETALEEISFNRETLYDRDAVDACLKLFQEGRYRLD